MRSLRAILAEGPLTIDGAVELMGRVLVALEADHRRGIVHGSLDPEHILVEGDTVELRRVPRTALGDARSDVRAAGVLLYELLCGSRPERDYARPSSLRPDLPQLLEDVIVCALRADADSRYSSAEEMRTALQFSTAPVLEIPDLRAPAPALAPAPAPAPESPPPPPPADAFSPPPDPPSVLDLDVAPSSPSLRVATPLPRPSVPSARTMVDDLPRGAGVGAGTIAIVFLLAAAIAGALVFGRSWFERKRAGRAADRVAVRLNVLPDDAAVRLDGQPLAGRQMELPLGSSHTLDVSAPGRIARHRAFTVTDVGTLALRLPHALGDFAPDDPPASPAELQHPPPGARDATAIDNAWRKLQRIEPCLGSEPPLSCAAELAAARDASPDAPALDAAIGELAAAFGDASVVPADLRARARAELLAERAVWEEAELDQIERDDGRYAGWHLRRVALAARALVRALGSPSAAEPLRKQRLAAFDAARAALRDHENHYPDDVKGTPGAEPFAAAADALAALARRAPRGKKAGSPPDPSVLLDSYGKLIAALNSAVLR